MLLLCAAATQALPAPATAEAAAGGEDHRPVDDHELLDGERPAGGERHVDGELFRPRRDRDGDGTCSLSDHAASPEAL